MEAIALASFYKNVLGIFLTLLRMYLKISSCFFQLFRSISNSFNVFLLLQSSKFCIIIYLSEFRVVILWKIWKTWKVEKFWFRSGNFFKIINSLEILLKRFPFFSCYLLKKKIPWPGLKFTYFSISNQILWLLWVFQKVITLSDIFSLLFRISDITLNISHISFKIF